MAEQSNQIYSGDVYSAQFLEMPEIASDSDISYAYAVIEPPYEGGDLFYDAYVSPVVSVDDVITTKTKKLVQLTVDTNLSAVGVSHEDRIKLAREGIVRVLQEVDSIENGKFIGM